MFIYLLLFLNILLMVAGQSLWKMGLDRVGGLQFHNMLQILISPLIVTGIMLYGAATIVWLAILSRLPLSIAYPLQSLVYVLGMLVAYFLFHETIPLHRWIGIGVIIIGVFIVSR